MTGILLGDMCDAGLFLLIFRCACVRIKVKIRFNVKLDSLLFYLIELDNMSKFAEETEN